MSCRRPRSGGHKFFPGLDACPRREARPICRESEGQPGGWLMFQKDSGSRPKKGAGQSSLGSRTLGTNVQRSDKNKEERPGGGQRGSL